MKLDKILSYKVDLDKILSYRFNFEEKNLVERFTRIIALSILLTVFFISGFNIYSGYAIIQQYEKDNNAYYNTLANSIYEIAKNDLKIKQFDNVKNLTNKLIENNLVMFVGIVDLKSRKYVWSSVKELIGTRAEIGNPWINNIYSKTFKQIDPSNIKEIDNYSNNCLIISNFYSKSTLTTLLEIILKGNFFLLLNFTIFGYLLAWISARSLTKPIMQLAYGAKEFSNGNLSYRSNISSNDEIGQLAKAFNDMATKLDNLYSSLEQQVKERTNELNNKNVQLESAYTELKEAQTLLVQNEKMSSLGLLTAGLAHELNNPINFIYGNLSHLKNYSEDLFKIIDSYETILTNLQKEDFDKINQVKDENEYTFILEDLPLLIKSCQDGAERCKQIILDLKNFSRLDEAVVKEVNIHEGIDSTLNILHNKIKNKVTINKDYGDIPLVSCYAGQLNQVFMNILDNAIAAIKERGIINIKTCTENNNVVIIIEDNGSGIEKEYLLKIFDPFFTTKPVGEGTGLGLAISYKIIKSHNGTIEVDSTKEKGTKFIIKLPLDWKKDNNKSINQEKSNL